MLNSDNRPYFGPSASCVLSANDCYTLGRIAFDAKDHYHALLWFREALPRSAQESPATVAKLEILPQYAISLKKQGNEQQARKMGLEFKKKAETRAFLKTVEGFPDIGLLLDESREYEGPQEEDEEMAPLKNERPDSRDAVSQPMYEALCRQEYRKEVSSSVRVCPRIRRSTSQLSGPNCKYQVQLLL